MSFNWIDFYQLADFLADSKGSFTEEAAHRSAVSRAYYSAFCHARNYALNDIQNPLVISTPDEKGKVHTLVIDYFKNNADRFLEPVGISLRHLRGWRNDCDYEDNFNPSPVVKQALLQADSVHKILP